MKKVNEMLIRRRPGAKPQTSRNPGQILSEASKPVKQAEEAAGKGNMKAHYSITRKLVGGIKILYRQTRLSQERRGAHRTQEEQRKRWAEDFKELLNRPPPSEMPKKDSANTPLQSNENRPRKSEIKRAEERKGSWRWLTIRSHQGRF